MVKYWVDYISNRGNNTVGYRTLEGFVTDVVNWVRSEHNDPEEMLYIYEEHNKSEGFFTPEEVRKMSSKEVRENYQQIMDSMRSWT